MKSGTLRRLVVLSVSALLSIDIYASAGAKDYVQDGLYIHFDAIANYGYDSETGEEIHGTAGSVLWSNLVAVTKTQKSKSQFTYTYYDDYVTIGGMGGVFVNDNSASRIAINNKSFTLQMLMKSTAIYADSYCIRVGELLRFGDADSKVPESPFLNFIYKGKEESVSPTLTTKYLNKDVLVTIVVDEDGASLSFDDGPVVHVNTGGDVEKQDGTTTFFSYLKAQVRSIRVYNKVLAPAERVENAIIDEVRYLGMDESYARSRVREAGDGSTEVKFAVTNSDSRVEYSIDDGQTWSGSIDTWLPAGETLILKARSTEPGTIFSWHGLGKNCKLPNNGANDYVEVSLMRPLFEDITANGIPEDSVLYWAGGSGNFDDPAMWLLQDGSPANFVPSISNGIVILNAETSGETDLITVREPLRAVSLELGGGGAGACNLQMKHIFTNQISGSVHLKSGAKISHVGSNPAGKSVTYKMFLDVGKDMTIDEGAAIDVNYAGYYRGTPLAGLGSEGPSAPHAGCRYDPSTVRYAYGSALEPESAGSGGYYGKGGGVVRLFVGGDLELNGKIESNGEPYYKGSRSGAGGSIWIRSGMLSGSGQISANGGYTQKGSSGSGGRIAIYQTDPSATDFTRFTGSVSACGGYVTTSGNDPGAAGTVYYQAYGQTPTSGTMIIDNAVVASSHSTANMYRQVTPLGEEFGLGDIGNLVVRNYAHVSISNRIINVYGDFTANDGTCLFEPYTGDFRFCGKEDAFISSLCTFDSFTCCEPGKRLFFGTGSASLIDIAEGGRLTLVGASGENVVLKPAVEGETWGLSVPESATAIVKYVTVDHSDASSGATVTARASRGAGGNINWAFPGFAISVR